MFYSLNLRAGCLFSIVALMLFHVITYSWPFLGIQVPTYNSTSMFPINYVYFDVDD
jgi:hypothetical protein